MASLREIRWNIGVVQVIVYSIGISIGALPLLAENSAADEFTEAAKNVRRVSPDQVSKLPEGIARQLKNLGCTIPQPSLPGVISDTPKAEEIQNIAKGEFAQKGQVDWAILCSKNGESAIRIFWGGSVKCNSEIRSSPDRDHLWSSNSKVTSNFSRSIRKLSPIEIDSPLLGEQEKIRELKAPKHDGIEDSFGNVATTLYCQHGEWLEIISAD